MSPARVVVTWKPQAGERDEVDRILGSDAAWRVDGADVRAAEGLLMFWPRSELRAAGLDWSDLGRCRWVKLLTAGANHVGWDPGPPVPVMTTPGASGDAIAEHVLAATLWWARGLGRHTRAIAGGRFEQGAPVRGLRELRVGLVGYGGIGRATARLLAGLGCTVEAVSRSGRAPPEDLLHLERLQSMRGLPGMAARCDVLVLCLPLHRDTLGLVDRSLLEVFGDGLLVNVARGPVVDEDALYDWLSSNRERRAAALDVWWRYPRDGLGFPFLRPFDTLPNVVMTPHDSPNVAGFRLRMLEAACRDVRAVLDGAPRTHVADPAAHRLAVEGDGR